MQEQLTFETESFGRNPTVDVLILLTLAALLSLWGLTAGPGLSDHESIIAQSARQIRQGDDWRIPRVADVPFVRKPPLAQWLVTLSSLAVDPPNINPPVSRYAARLPSALAALLTTLLVYVLGRSMFGHRTGLVCGVASAFSAAMLFYSHSAQVEMVLTLFTTAALTFFWLGTEGGAHRRVYLTLFYACFGIAMLAKAPLPLVTVGGVLAVWWFVTVPLARLGDHADAGLGKRLVAQVRGVRGLFLIPGLLIFLVIFLPWPLYVFFKIDNALELWQIEYVQRYSGGLNSSSKAFWYYIPIALALAFPFSLSLFEAFASPFLAAHRERRKGLLFALTWALVHIGFLSTSAFKRPHYLISAAPAFAILLGPTLERLFLAARTMSRARLRLAVWVLALGLIAGVPVGGLFILRDYPHVMHAYVVGGGVLIAAGVACGMLFLSGRRLASFLLLNACVGVGFALTWDALGQARALNRRAYAIVDKLRELRVTPEQRITWCVGRPDARLMFYLGRRIDPLFSPLELATRRKNRTLVPKELLIEGMQRLEERFASGQREYFVIDADYFRRWRENSDTPVEELLRVYGGREDSERDDLVLIAGNSPAKAASE